MPRLLVGGKNLYTRLENYALVHPHIITRPYTAVQVGIHFSDKTMIGSINITPIQVFAGTLGVLLY